MAKKILKLKTCKKSPKKSIKKRGKGKKRKSKRQRKIHNYSAATAGTLVLGSIVYMAYKKIKELNGEIEELNSELKKDVSNLNALRQRAKSLHLQTQWVKQSLQGIEEIDNNEIGRVSLEELSKIRSTRR